MTLQFVTLRNFQKHRFKKIRFDPFVTTIIGENGAGKSTIVRALEWVCFNRPAGDEVFAWGKKTTKVTLRIDGHTIIRKRGKGINLYIVDGKRYKAFGQSVPEAVAKIVNVSNANFQRQLDSPFWFLETPGQVSKEINQIIDLEIIDSTLAKLTSQLRRRKIAADVSHQRLSSIRKQAKSLRYIRIVDKQLSKLEKKHVEIVSNASSVRCLALCVKNAIDARRDVFNAGDATIDARKLIKQASQCVRIAEDVWKLQKAVDAASTLARSSGADVDDLSASLSTLDNLTKDCQRKQNQIERLSKILRRIKHLRISVCQNNQSAIDAEHKLHRLMEGRCPICKRPFRKTS